MLQLTTHRLLWDDEEQEVGYYTNRTLFIVVVYVFVCCQGRSLAFDLKLVDKLDTVQSGFRRRCVHVHAGIPRFHPPSDGRCNLSIIFICFYCFSAKIKVYLLQAPASQTGGPSNVNKHNFVQLSFRKGGQEEVLILYYYFIIIIIIISLIFN